MITRLKYDKSFGIIRQNLKYDQYIKRSNGKSRQHGRTMDNILRRGRNSNKVSKRNTRIKKKYCNIDERWL